MQAKKTLSDTGRKPTGSEAGQEVRSPPETRREKVLVACFNLAF